MDRFLSINDAPANPPKPKPKPTSTPVDGSDRKFYIQAAEKSGDKKVLQDFDAALDAQSQAAPPKPRSNDGQKGHVKPERADDPSDQKFYNMAADRQNEIIDLENRAASLQRVIDALGTSSGHVTDEMRAELEEVEAELDGYRRQDLRARARELEREIAAVPNAPYVADAKAQLQSELDAVNQQITALDIKKLEAEAADIEQKLADLPSDSFSGYARQALEERLAEIEGELDALSGVPDVPYDELGVDEQQFDALVSAAMREGGLSRDEAVRAISSSLEERKAAEDDALEGYVEKLLNVPGPLAEQIVAYNRGEIDQVDGLPPDVQAALSRVEIRLINGTDQPFLVGDPVDVEAIGDHFADMYGSELSAYQLNDGTWATERPFDAHIDGPTSGDLHTFLDVLGFVPVVGEVADGVNALIYLAEGDWTNAGISAAALIPVGGQLATGARVLDRSRDLIKGLDATLEAATTVDGVTVNVLKLQDGSYAKVLELEDGTTAVLTGSADELGLDAARFGDDVPVGQVDEASGLSGAAPNIRQYEFNDAGTGDHLRRTTDVDGTTVQINSGHGYDRAHRSGDVRDSGLSMDEIDNAIVNDIANNVDVDNLPTVPQMTQRVIDIDGYRLGYNVTVLPNGNVSVSTYYPAP